MNKRTLLAATSLLAVIGMAGSATAAPTESDGRWKVTITNLTPAGSQPMSPPLVVIHSGRADVWSAGTIANHGVAAIAEDANNAPLMEALAGVRGVGEVFAVAGDPIPPGASRTFEVESVDRFRRISLLTMLVNTNDGFTGLDSKILWDRTIRTGAYDAGSEANNELAAFIPGPCCMHRFVRAPEGALIRHHPGISGDGDLDPGVYGWEGDVARITIEAVH